MKLQTVFFLIALVLSHASRAEQVPATVVDLEFTDDSYGQYQDFASEAAKAMELMINSNEFKDRVMELRMSKKGGFTNSEIYDLLKNGIEKKCPERVAYTDVVSSDCPKKTVRNELACTEREPRVINLKVRTLNVCDGSKWVNRNCKLDSLAKTIGIDGSGDGITAICPQRLELWSNRNGVAELAGHYTHEYLHILGFSHSWFRKKRSAVYQIGYLVRDMINEDTVLNP